MRPKKKHVILSLFLLCFSLLLLDDLFEFINFKSPKFVKSPWSPTVDQNSSTTEPLILLYRKLEKDKYWGFNWANRHKRSALHLGKCPHKCRYTINSKRYMDTADMVIVNAHLYRNPPIRVPGRQRILENQMKTGQIWVGFTVESPLYVVKFNHEADDVFHWIANYRRDADIFWPNWSYTKRSQAPLKAAPVTKKSKKKLAAWLVSHCSTESQRRLLVETLQRHIQVDIYGKCGKPCPKGLDCPAYIAANYKFYLAFENSLCVDYVTEKLFGMLNQTEPIVPVTYSWLNDTTLAPPNSYIDASDFKSVKDLAEYLQYLDKNGDKYNDFLRWKNDYEIVKHHKDTQLCRACQMLLRYKEQLAGGGERMRRQPSFLNWLNSLGSGANFSYFKVAGNLVQMKSVCFKPLENKESRNWLLGTN